MSTSYQDAKLAWEKIKDNLIEINLLDKYRWDNLDPYDQRDVDEEQIQAIRSHMNLEDYAE